MNGDLCSFGKKLYIEWFMWKCIPLSIRQWLKPKEIHAYRVYRKHMNTCEQCKGVSDDFQV